MTSPSYNPSSPSYNPSSPSDIRGTAPNAM
jgi:hypothetical protein